VIPIDKEVYQQLSEEDQKIVSVFVQAGCCMYKALNVMKHGFKALALFWENAAVEKPMIFYNKDNNKAAQIGGEEVQEQAEKLSEAGAIRLLSLAGAAFQNKDNKKREQDMCHIFFEVCVTFKCACAICISEQLSGTSWLF
jgi:hypothetical protein